MADSEADQFGMTPEAHAKALQEIEEQLTALGLRLRDLIVTQPPLDLLGWIAAQPLLTTSDVPDEKGDAHAQKIVERSQFLLEYVHATLASAPSVETGSLDEATCAEITETAETLRMQAAVYGMIKARSAPDETFGDATAEIMMRAMTTWVIIRGNRYQQLEGEFYGHVLAPHDELLRETYGMGAADIADAIQRFADSQRTGQMRAAEQLRAAYEAFNDIADENGIIQPDVAEEWRLKHATSFEETFVDLFRAGSHNASQKSGLPEALLEDLSYGRGEDNEFFADGSLQATPLRTLPVRKKPLIEIEGQRYALDACQMRDAGYRAILYNIQVRRPDAAKAIREAQSAMCEKAFPEVFGDHLRGARIHQSVYYRDPATRQWVENDLLILLDDVLIQIEAKSGAAATIASPASDFGRHASALTRLVLDAYHQCSRFLAYLYSAEEVPIYARQGKRYVEVVRIRHADYRIKVPIGLTVETFSPFSAMSKTLPEIVPIEGRHAFLSLSIDELFVLRRFLPTAGALAHYLLVRQAAAAKPELHLFDELDNLGAYITRNRYDTAYHDEHSAQDAQMIVVDGASEVIDLYFSAPDAPVDPPQGQAMPGTLIDLLALIDRDRPVGWLELDAHIRDYDAETRDRLGKELETTYETLRTQQRRRMVLGGERPLFLWAERIEATTDDAEVGRRAAAAAIATRSNDLIAARLYVDARAKLAAVAMVPVVVPPPGTRDRRLVEEDAQGLMNRSRSMAQAQAVPKAPTKIGRNQPCWCGSGKKFKKCHG
ncbi:YecA family protein [Jannaschia marina]|uniref:YecA family protein n=1 Tax=Jannaschia marina TaxID=2741674 RepID=UPI0015CC02B9|nr:SEC-C metal-binding domain-containing protein [Jannaschia marina]